MSGTDYNVDDFPPRPQRVKKWVFQEKEEGDAEDFMAAMLKVCRGQNNSPLRKGIEAVWVEYVYMLC